ncbi:histidine kinase N-terminal 7TM domain-containing protein [Natrarchaeobius sp. A-rgal3]|uniref:histidine kinase N-terminal 7TM domain-containing protein n=1 Tax=Natrarchaeobius versutus TaxID=1679078 RepID=UPI00350EEF7A
MSWGVSLPVAIVLASGTLSFLLALEAIRNRPNPMSWPVAFLLVSAAAWAFPYGISIAATDPETVRLWNELRYPGTVAVPVAYLVVATTYAGKGEWLSRQVYGLLSVVPAVVLTGVWTNQYHGYYFRSVAVTRVQEASVVAVDPGPLFWLNVAYSYLLVGASLVLLARVFFRSGTLYRKQSALLVVAGSVPLVTNAFVNVVTEPGSTIDFTAPALTVSGGAFALALFHFDLLDLRPVARDVLVEELDDGVIVVDRNETVADVNAVAKRILDDPEIGDPVGEIFPADYEIGDELAVRIDGRTCVYRYRSTPLTDRLDRQTGRIVHLDDVTGLIDREQRISVLNRVLQHNLRNELSLVIGHLETAAESASSPADDHIDAAKESASRVVSLGRKARTLEQTLGASSNTEAVDVTAVTDRVIETTATAYPEATLECTTPESSVPTAVASELLVEASIENLLENAVVHNDTARPHVAVRIETNDERVHVSVADDGPGIPEDERRILESRTETPLAHGSGLGLWIAKWTTTLSKGELSISDNEPRGTVVTLSFRVAGRASETDPERRTEA